MFRRKHGVTKYVDRIGAIHVRPQTKRSHTVRNAVLIVAGAGAAIGAAALLRDRLRSKAVRGPATVDAEIEVGVPVTTAYNQWTQFEEFPHFMEGVDEVKQLDDTMLHWAATVAGRHAEWDAKIIEQKPDSRIAWESVDGKRTRGTVTFEQAGPERSRVRLHMSYTPDGAAEHVGSAIGLDRRRITGDLARFRELIEGRTAASGAWRGEIEDGKPPVTETRRSPFFARRERRKLMLLWIIVLLLVIFAIGGGVAVSNLLWLLLVVALIVAVVGLVSGRRAI